MTPIACSLCSKPYNLGPDQHRSFCATCVGKIHRDAAQAETHMNLIRAGDMNVIPTNERERSIQHAARRQQLDPNTKDQNFKRKSPNVHTY